MKKSHLSLRSAKINIVSQLSARVEFNLQKVVHFFVTVGVDQEFFSARKLFQRSKISDKNLLSQKGVFSREMHQHLNIMMMTHLKDSRWKTCQFSTWKKMLPNDPKKDLKAALAKISLNAFQFGSIFHLSAAYFLGDERALKSRITSQ